jgi:site-specific recombinase XerD
VKKPLASVTLTDLQAWAETLGQGSPASINRALTAVKSLLSFAHETGYLPFNVGIAVKLRPNRDSLAQRIMEENLFTRHGAGRTEHQWIDRAATRDAQLIELLYPCEKQGGCHSGLFGGNSNFLHDASEARVERPWCTGG